MRTMARVVVLVLAVAFLAGWWQARHPPERSPARAPLPFRTSPLERSGLAGGPAPELISVGTLRRDGYDRVLFTFRGAVPGYQVRYVSGVQDEAGRRLALRGRAALAVAFEPARARDPGGATTFEAATLTIDYPSLRQVRFAGDFEGTVSFGVGVAARGGFRVTELRDPTRVAVDVRA
jgi:hypothetical protein